MMSFLGSASLRSSSALQGCAGAAAAAIFPQRPPREAPAPLRLLRLRLRHRPGAGPGRQRGGSGEEAAMSGGRQAQLPRAWRLPRAKAAEPEPEPGVAAAGGEAEAEAEEDEEEDDDLLLAAAAAAADPSPAPFPASFPSPAPFPSPARSPSPPAAGFCLAAGSLWIYPTNLPVRGYQLRMARAALLANTLLCLPTGLGKTFVAAVVMYNFYRWFPSGKVLFLAPTKPLVAQQMEACARLMGIPARHMAEMTGGCCWAGGGWAGGLQGSLTPPPSLAGGTQALSRRDLWATKRVFFLTPQVMVNDLSRGSCPYADIKCLVIDEAHKALGNHAYCQVTPQAPALLLIEKPPKSPKCSIKCGCCCWEAFL